jgi:hypothetical protein
MKFLVQVCFIIFFGLFPNNYLEAVKINCSSPVHKNKPRCKGKSENKTPKEFDTWFPIGFNENGISVGWVQFKSYEELNENSFRVRGKFTYPNNLQSIGKLDINCKNKDFYFRPKGVWGVPPDWSAIPQGSGIESVAYYFCKRTAAKEEWGYTDATAYLWDIPEPPRDPSNLEGEWILQYDRDDGEAYYNTSVIKNDKTVIYGYFSRSKNGDRSAAQPYDKSKYKWVNNSCTENLGSVFFKPEISVTGVWLPPVPGRPGGTNMQVRKQYCN